MNLDTYIRIKQAEYYSPRADMALMQSSVDSFPDMLDFINRSKGTNSRIKIDWDPFETLDHEKRLQEYYDMHGNPSIFRLSGANKFWKLKNQLDDMRSKVNR